MGLAGMEVILKLATFHKLDICQYCYFILISGFKNPSHESGSLREKCPNTELFLVVMQENTDQKQLRIWTLSTQWM